MMQSPKPSTTLRLLQSTKIRMKNRLRHILLVSIEKMPAPFRFAWRNILFAHLPSLFTDCSAYQAWQQACDYFIDNRPASIQIIDLKNIANPQTIVPKKIAIQAHLFYLDLAPQLVSLLAKFPLPFDLLISTVDATEEELLLRQFQGLPNLQSLHIRITPNRGRDLGPMLFSYGQDLLQYDCIAHIHTKKSVGTNTIGNLWRNYLWEGLLSNSNHRIPKIIDLLSTYGLIYPQKFPHIDIQNCQWSQNLASAKDLCDMLKVPHPPNGYIEFPAGSMFWANPAALKPLLDYPYTPDIFEKELGQSDGTIVHVIERSLAHIAQAQGYPIGLLRYPSPLSYYP